MEHIRGGSRPLFRLTRSVRTERRGYEEKERDPRLLEEKQRDAAARGARCCEGSAAASSTAGENGKAAGYIDEIGAARIVAPELIVRWIGNEKAGRFWPAFLFGVVPPRLPLSLEIDPRFGEIRQEMVGLTLFVERPL